MTSRYSTLIVGHVPVASGLVTRDENVVWLECPMSVLSRGSLVAVMLLTMELVQSIAAPPSCVELLGIVGRDGRYLMVGWGHILFSLEVVASVICLFLFLLGMFCPKLQLDMQLLLNKNEHIVKNMRRWLGYSEICMNQLILIVELILVEILAL